MEEKPDNSEKSFYPHPGIIFHVPNSSFKQIAVFSIAQPLSIK
jgi:hypothetical protein